ncbi:MAG TPA: single-stranded DNA-binding protein [Verrucomicrobiae bacterium]|nr:single-stranded DNA-binding protein [Verrucomicrobiae bacterium]
MASYNKVLLMGNLTRDPEVRYTPKGTAIANLGLAVNRVYTTESGEQKEEVTFVDIEVWGRQAETAGQYLSKGRPVFVEGRLRLDSWEDKESGQKRNRLKVVAERVQFLGAPRGGAEFKDQAPADEAPVRPAARGGRAAPAQSGGGEPEPTTAGEDDNIPF